MLYTLYYYSEVQNKKEHRRSKNKAFFQNNTKTQTISLISTFSKLFSNLTTWSKQLNFVVQNRV